MLSIFQLCSQYRIEKGQIIDFVDLMFAYDIESDLDRSILISKHSFRMKDDEM